MDSKKTSLMGNLEGMTYQIILKKKNWLLLLKVSIWIIKFMLEELSVLKCNINSFITNTRYMLYGEYWISNKQYLQTSSFTTQRIVYKLYTTYSIHPILEIRNVVLLVIFCHGQATLRSCIRKQFRLETSRQRL